MSSEVTPRENLPDECEVVIEELFTRCSQNAPNFGVRVDCFKASLDNAAGKYLGSASRSPADNNEIKEFLEQIQADDLFWRLACANGNERAWWEFDQQHRAYLLRVARHLAKTELDAQEVVDQVYVDLYGTHRGWRAGFKVFHIQRGGSLRGWLRTVIWHSLVDLHRQSHDEVSLDEMTENVGEGAAHATFAEAAPGGEDEMIDHLAKERYRKATLSAIESAFSALDDHEKLLLLYYHVESLKLREIARLVENEGSPLRGWFQRKSQTRDKNPSGRIHESTIMRWLEKSYERVLQLFRRELETQNGFSREEIDICLELASQDLGAKSLFGNLITT